MEGMILHKGGELITRDQLDLIKVPEQTDTYFPISHYQLSGMMLTMSRDLLKDYVLVGEQYAIARQGQQLFALLRFNRDNSEIGLSIAYRNSLDKSMSVGIAIGGVCFICDNLALHGDITVMRKHTKNVWTELENITIATLYKSEKNLDKVIADAERLKAISMSNDEAFQLMGRLYGNNIVSPRQLTVLKEEWLKPSHAEFNERNKWAMFNATTECLKSCPPISILEKHIEAYNMVIDC